MGRHSTDTKPPKPRERVRNKARAQARTVWHLLPETWRGRVWAWRQRWRAFQDRRHTPPGEWDAHLPKDAAFWSDSWDFGSYGVAAELRAHRRQRGDLLPVHHPDQETP